MKGREAGRLVTDLLRSGEVPAAGGLSLELAPPHGGAQAMGAGDKRRGRRSAAKGLPDCLSSTRGRVEAAEPRKNQKPYRFSHYSGLGISGRSGMAARPSSLGATGRDRPRRCAAMEPDSEVGVLRNSLRALVSCHARG